MNSIHEPQPEPDYDELDLGIRKVVRLLWANRFETTDSGDGKSKGAPDGECVVGYPHVHMFVPVPDVDRDSMMSRPQDIVRACLAVTECHRLYAIMRSCGVSFNPKHYDSPLSVPLVQVMYGYPDGTFTLSLVNVDDALLARSVMGSSGLDRLLED